MYEDRPYAMVVESACFEGRRRRDPARCPANYSAYVAGLGESASTRATGGGTRGKRGLLPPILATL